MGLEIEFFNGHPSMQVGRHAPVRVWQADAGGGRTSVSIADVEFQFGPVVWGKVSPTDDPAIGDLAVIELAVSEDVLLEPSYTITASLSRQGGQTIQPQRQVRILPAALEIELAFEIGREGEFTPFTIQDLSQPLDWSLACVSDPATQTIVMREGVPFLRLTKIDAFPTRVDITFPNGEVSSLILDGRIAPRRLADSAPHARPSIEPPADQPAEAPAELAPAASDQLADDLQGELSRLQRYVASFGGAQRSSDPENARRIRERIQGKLDALRPQVEAHTGPNKAQLTAAFEALCAEGLSATV